TAAAAGWFVVDRHLIRLPMTTPDRLRPAASAVPAVPAPAPDAGDAVLENLLARADHALGAGQIVTPPGASAADLYREALRRNAPPQPATSRAHWRCSTMPRAAGIAQCWSTRRASS